jgi:hypothetical protein
VPRPLKGNTALPQEFPSEDRKAPSPTLPRKRGREGPGYSARATSSISKHSMTSPARMSE